jgi:hypothetical protein
MTAEPLVVPKYLVQQRHKVKKAKGVLTITIQETFSAL